MDKKNQEEFLIIVNQFQRIIKKYCIIYGNDIMTSEDLYQETLYNLWKNYSSYKGLCKLSTWVYRITINTCINSIRLKYKEGKQLELRSALNICDDDNVEKRENKEMLLNIIGQLSLIDKSIMLLWLEEKSYKEIAEIIGLSETNIATRLNRCKMKVKSMFNLMK